MEEDIFNYNYEQHGPWVAYVTNTMSQQVRNQSPQTRQFVLRLLDAPFQLLDSYIESPPEERSLMDIQNAHMMLREYLRAIVATDEGYMEGGKKRAKKRSKLRKKNKSKQKRSLRSRK